MTDTAKTNFPDAGCNGILLQDVYHHLTNPAAMNRSITAALKAGGRVAVIDFIAWGGSTEARPTGTERQTRCHA